MAKVYKGDITGNIVELSLQDEAAAGGGGSSTVIAPFAFARIDTTSNGSGTGISWSNWNAGSGTLDITFDTAQANTNYTVVTDGETNDDGRLVSVQNKTTSGFEISLYDPVGVSTPSAANSFAIIVYGETPTIDVQGGSGGEGGTVQTPTTLQIRATDEGTVTGDARGANSVDLQTVRTVSTQVASGSESMILGGHGNTASGSSSEVIGSHDSTTTGTGSTVIGGNTINNAGNWSVAAGGRNHEIVAARVGVLGGEHTEVLTGHNDSVMLGVRGTGAAKKQSQAAETAHVDNLYIFNGFTMPTGAADTYVLTSDANGVGTWQAAAGGSGGGGTTQTPTTLQIRATDEGIVAGNARGTNSVDLQTSRSLATQVASGDYSIISGGRNNTASDFYSTAGGGMLNTASGFYSTIGGGFQNHATGTASTVGGGDNNTAFDGYSTVGGGRSNTASGLYSTVSGGYGNDANANYSTISGGSNNTASGNYSVAAGRRAKTGANDGVFIFADSTNADFTALAANTFNIRASGGLRLVDGNETNGYVLTCDANGTGTWQAAGGGGGGGTVQTAGTFQIRAANEGVFIAGNTRGTNSVDLQTNRQLVTQVASGVESVICGGIDNTASGEASAVGGGSNNTASGYKSTIGGGRDNTASGYYSTVSGGYNNDASGVIDGAATICGGKDNLADGEYSTVVGGRNNTATGNYSVAAGRRAKTGANTGSFRFADSTDADFTAGQNPDTFGCRFSGGYNFYSDSGATVGVTLAASGTAWGVLSDRNAKENFEQVDTAEVLNKVKELPITTWNLKAQDANIRHMGPMAQDFHAAFGLAGDVDTRIETGDSDGVLYAAIKGLLDRIESLEAEIIELKNSG